MPRARRHQGKNSSRTGDLRPSQKIERAASDHPEAALSAAFMKSFQELIDNGDRESALMSLNRQIQHAHALLDEIEGDYLVNGVSGGFHQ